MPNFSNMTPAQLEAALIKAQANVRKQNAEIQALEERLAAVERLEKQIDERRTRKFEAAKRWAARRADLEDDIKAIKQRLTEAFRTRVKLQERTNREEGPAIQSQIDQQIRIHKSAKAELDNTMNKWRIAKSAEEETDRQRAALFDKAKQLAQRRVELKDRIKQRENSVGRLTDAATQIARQLRKGNTGGSPRRR